MQKANADLQETETVVADAIVGGDIAEIEGDTRKEGGIIKENVTIYPQFMKDEEEQKKFIDAGKGSVVVFNPYKAFEGLSLIHISLRREHSRPTTGIERRIMASVLGS